MTKEERQILLKDLCARLPYGVKVLNTAEGINEISVLDSIFLGKEIFVGLHARENIMTGLISVKPYLRQMSSMTEEEGKEYKNLFEYEEREYNQGCCFFDEYKIDIDDEYRLTTVIDWLNSHHFDYRGLIEMGLALEAPEGMYKNN